MCIHLHRYVYISHVYTCVFIYIDTFTYHMCTHMCIHLHRYIYISHVYAYVYSFT